MNPAGHTPSERPRMMLACVAVLIAGCTNVVDAGTVVPSSQAKDASSDPPVLAQEELCTRTGGTIETRSCCSGTGDFPRMCWHDSCACNVGSPNVTMLIARLCVCPQDSCFAPTAMGPFTAGCYRAVMSSGPDAASEASEAPRDAQSSGMAEASAITIDR